MRPSGVCSCLLIVLAVSALILDAAVSSQNSESTASYLPVTEPVPQDASLKADEKDATFTVNSGEPKDANIVVGAVVKLAVQPVEFDKVSDDPKNPTSLFMDLLCGRTEAVSRVFLNFQSVGNALVPLMSDATLNLTGPILEKAQYSHYEFADGKAKFSTATNPNLTISYKGSNCWLTADGKPVLKARFSTTAAGMNFDVLLENDMVAADTLKPAPSSRAAPVKESWTATIIFSCVCVFGGNLACVLAWIFCFRISDKEKEEIIKGLLLQQAQRRAKLAGTPIPSSLDPPAAAVVPPAPTPASVAPPSPGNGVVVQRVVEQPKTPGNDGVAANAVEIFGNKKSDFLR